MGKSGGGPDEVTQNTKSEPWIGAQPYLTDYLQRSQAQSNRRFQFNDGDQIAPFSPEQQYGLGMTTQRAINGSPVMNSAQGNAFDTLNGAYMSPDSNPYLKANVGQALDDVTGRVNTQFGNNNFGGSAHQETLTRNLGDTASSMYGANYDAERNRQMSAIGMAPGLAESDYRDAQALLGVGDARQGLAQQYLNQANGLFDSSVAYPQQQLDAYGRAANMGVGAGGQSSSTGPNPNQGSNTANLIGTGLSAYGLLGGMGSLFAGGAASGGLGALGGAAFAMSDQRLKSNIVKVADDPRGFGIYEYDIFNRRERGVMAQEIEKIMPDAVSTHSSGYKQVNYAKLG